MFRSRRQKNSRTVVCCKTPLSEEPTPICVLNQGIHENEKLDLKFGSAATFILEGHEPSTVYLTGYIQPEDMRDLDDIPEDYDMEEALAAKFKNRYPMEDEDEEMFPPEPDTKKRKVENAPKKSRSEKTTTAKERDAS